MRVQILFILLFALNMFFLWLTFSTKKFTSYRSLGELVFIVLPFLGVFFAQPRFELDHSWWIMAGFAAILLGLGNLIWAIREMMKAGIKKLDIIPDKFIVSGPFQFVRHPLYLSMIFICVGWWWVWSAVYTFYFGMIILILIWIEAYLEEKFVLEKLFGDQYREYRATTGMFWIK